MKSTSDALKLGQRITILPVVHGSGDFAVEVRRLMLSTSFDCVAVPLPPSFQNEVEAAVQWLPNVSVVLQREPKQTFATETEYSPDDDDDDDDDIESMFGGENPFGEEGRASYVPVDPCQPVIAALRIAMQEHISREFIDIEDEHYLPVTAILPDPYALKQVSTERFAAAVLPAIAKPEEDSRIRRIHWMANELHRLAKTRKSILFVCSVLDWPWIRDAYQSAVDRPPAAPKPANPARIFAVEPRTLTFVLGELPFITGRYEQARAELDDDENLSIDGIKSLLLAARDSYREEFKKRARPITPQLLKVLLKYARNLSLMERRFTPDLYTLVSASQQIAGDQFAIHVAETARSYPYFDDDEHPEVRFGIDQIILPDFTHLKVVSRLPGHPMVWRSCNLNPRPERQQQVEWQRAWNPFGQCSWPPEDEAIERFRTHIKDSAIDLIGNDLARTEKFGASMKDGLDIRETLRNWHTGDLYVKVFPPARGKLDCVVMLFDSPADPRDYPWRITWHAEHHDESTLSLFATDFHKNPVGPGICLAQYGGCMFLFPPRPIPDIFHDPRFNFTDTLEERLLAAALFYSREKHIALLSHSPPGAGWRRLARKYKKKIVHVPMTRFGSSTIDKLRMFHVLNGQPVRSFAADFIRKP
ncbi:hypothetical protein [Fuerstiella marisgermanici]|uniref:Uncharacterized protein n=1 Tax=Fuerstiella marisgermanici TaxID=1891926 RepID=A0A1P8WJ62_9PLAN|nr:hypothetical protein [Fuerstiella marisgermanici]APZ94094.1 hypothetical protein Fuma_03715 [Fuerstiella marisgermanici]